MVGRENSVTVIVKTEIRHRKKKTEIKGKYQDIFIYSMCKQHNS